MYRTIRTFEGPFGDGKWLIHVDTHTEGLESTHHFAAGTEAEMRRSASLLAQVYGLEAAANLRGLPSHKTREIERESYYGRR